MPVLGGVSHVIAKTEIAGPVDMETTCLYRDQLHDITITERVPLLLQDDDTRFLTASDGERRSGRIVGGCTQAGIVIAGWRNSLVWILAVERGCTSMMQCASVESSRL
ncbi:hypothetical protein A2U01_0052428 [Trifolium medium]|uniref:Uncharacterized protein n=1 Tax=Trifolium medium TaxID=97028 RepID=A0A392R5T8_9FABA|nr:hypothetical protein [Trifolium medium]